MLCRARLRLRILGESQEDAEVRADLLQDGDRVVTGQTGQRSLYDDDVNAVLNDVGDGFHAAAGGEGLVAPLPEVSDGPQSVLG